MMLNKQAFPTLMHLRDSKTGDSYFAKANVIFSKPKELTSNTLYVDHSLDNAMPNIKRLHYFIVKKNSLIEYNNDYISYAKAKELCENKTCSIEELIARIAYWNEDDESAYVFVERLVLNSLQK